MTPHTPEPTTEPEGFAWWEAEPLTDEDIEALLAAESLQTNTER